MSYKFAYVCCKINRDLKSWSLIVDLVDNVHDDFAAVALWNRVRMRYAMTAPTRRHLCPLRIQKYIIFSTMKLAKVIRIYHL